MLTLPSSACVRAARFSANGDAAMLFARPPLVAVVTWNIFSNIQPSSRILKPVRQPVFPGIRDLADAQRILLR